MTAWKPLHKFTCSAHGAHPGYSIVSCNHQVHFPLGNSVTGTRNEWWPRYVLITWWLLGEDQIWMTQSFDLCFVCKVWSRIHFEEMTPKAAFTPGWSDSNLISFALMQRIWSFQGCVGTEIRSFQIRLESLSHVVVDRIHIWFAELWHEWERTWMRKEFMLLFV